LKRIPSFWCNLFMINKLQLDYKPVQLILAVNYEYIISDCDLVVSFKEVVGDLNLLKLLQKVAKIMIQKLCFI